MSSVSEPQGIYSPINYPKVLKWHVQYIAAWTVCPRLGYS